MLLLLLLLGGEEAVDSCCEIVECFGHVVSGWLVRPWVRIEKGGCRFGPVDGVEKSGWSWMEICREV